MTDIDWDLNLLKDIKGTNMNVEQQDIQVDLMLQPITTQQNFKLKKKLLINEKQTTRIEQTTSKPIIKLQSNKDSVNLKEQSQKFRDYLSQKVQQLRKSKELINPYEKKPIHDHKLQNKKNSTLRNIINQQELKQKDAQKPKIQSNIKKSIHKQIHRKSMQTPSLTPPLKPQLFKKNNDTSVNDQRNTKNSITIDHNSNKSQKQVHGNDRKKTPQSKNSFRIKRTSNIDTTHQASIDVQKSTEVSIKSFQKQSPMRQSKNKRMREQFMRLNQEQRKLQQQIFIFHKQSKHELENIMKKYQISSSNFQKYGLLKEIEAQQYITEENKQKTSPSKKSIEQSKVQKTTQKKIKQNDEPIALSPIKKQKEKNSVLDSQLEILNNLLKTKNKEIEKLESKIEKNPYIQFLRDQPSEIQEQLEEDEADIVQQLPSAKIVKPSPNFSGKQFQSTYSSVMSQMKNKKWGLKQRITFETHRQSSQKKYDKKQFRTGDNFSSLQKRSPLKNKIPQQILQQEQYSQNENLNNRVQVNSRLKGLLFD